MNEGAPEFARCGNCKHWFEGGSEWTNANGMRFKACNGIGCDEKIGSDLIHMFPGDYHHGLIVTNEAFYCELWESKK